MSEVVPLPSEKTYVEAVNSAVDADKLSSADDLKRAIKRDTYNDRGFAIGMANAEKWGQLLERQDRSLEGVVDTRRLASEAIRLGTGFGLLVLPHAHRQFITIQDAILNIPTINNPQSNDPFEVHHEIAVQVMELGDQGVAFMGEEANERLMDIEMRMVEKVEHQRMFRIGCGIVALGGFIAHDARIRGLEERARRESQRELEKSLESIHDVDWDAAFSTMLNGESNARD